jgi:hemerythrin
MRSIRWTTSEAVWIEEIDDDHKEIFAQVAALEETLSGAGGPADIRKVLERLTDTIVGHFEHEERLMRASRYDSLRWHKGLHEAATRNVQRSALAIRRGDRQAGLLLVGYLTDWLQDHTRVADRMMASHLRNRCLTMGKVVLRAGTKPADACTWVDSRGNSFDPLAKARKV